MFRKAGHIILLILLLISTTGFAISKHYCGTKLVSISIDSDAKSCCGDDTGKCCHDKSEHFQLKEDFVSSFDQFNFDNDFCIELDFIMKFNLVLNNEVDNIKEFIPHYNSPPPPNILSVLARLQTYLL